MIDKAGRLSLAIMLGLQDSANDRSKNCSEIEAAAPKEPSADLSYT